MVATLAQPLNRASQPKDRFGMMLLILVNIIGVVAFVAPFFARVHQSADETGNSRMGESFLLMMVLIGACLVVIFAQLGSTLNTKSIALIGVLLAINSVLRLIDLLIPLPGGFSPIFLLVILMGYVYGPQMGFLMGALTLLGSAIITGGIGPWLPFQMFTAGWVGVLAGWLPNMGQNPRLERLMLAGFGVFVGIFYGFVTNLYFWPFFAGEAAQSWQSGLSFFEGVGRYLVFYGVTSVWWDVFRSVGNFILLMTLGTALVQAFRRYQLKFFPEIT
jgi:energy-coupling factor transport system substrate-specific component